VLELGKPGAHGTGRGVRPVLSDGAVVATLDTSSWKEAATAQVGNRSWVFAKRGGQLTGRSAADPVDAVRLRARRASLWKGTWELTLDGVPVESATASWWRGTRRYLSAGRVVAESGSTGGWSTRPTLTVHADVPLDHSVFLLWLELVLRRRSDSAAAGGAAAGAIAAGS
jgi:hypothetical protein